MFSAVTGSPWERLYSSSWATANSRGRSSVVAATIDGQRPMLLEVQALAASLNALGSRLILRLLDRTRLRLAAEKAWAEATRGDAAILRLAGIYGPGRGPFEKVRNDKTREANDGFDGSWVAHPDLVPVCQEVFDGVLDGIGLSGEDNAGRRLTVLRAIDKLDRLGDAGVRELLGAGRKDESGDFTKGAGLPDEAIGRVLAFTGWTGAGSAPADNATTLANFETSLAGSAKHAQRHVDNGVDIVIAQGGEAGGHTGDVATMVLVPEIVKARHLVGIFPPGGSLGFLPAAQGPRSKVGSGGHAAQ